MKTRRWLLTAASMLPLALHSGIALAQSPYPAKPIRWVVSAPAGSPIDAIARKLGEVASKSLGQAIVIDNKPGAVGSIAAGEVARAPADGYTFLLCVSDPLVAALAVLKKLPYDPRKDFSFISKVASSPVVLVANPSVQANNLASLIGGIKSGNTAMAYGSWGPGTIPMQIMGSLGRQAGVEFREIPYRGSPPALQDTLAGRVEMTFLAPYVAAPLIAEGKLKALGTVSDKRSSLLPEVPTFKEAGYTAFVFSNPVWVGLVAPAGLDAGVQQRIAETVRTAVQGGEMRKFLGDIGFTAVGNGPAEFEREYRAEVGAIPQLIRELGVVPE